MNPMISSVSRYLVALLAIVAAFLLRHLLPGVVEESLPPYFTFYPTIMIIALVGGLGPGIFATIAAGLIIDYFMLSPHGFGIAKRGDLIVLVFFYAMGLFMSVVASRYLQMRNRLKEAVAARTESLHLANEELQLQGAELIEANEGLRIAQESLQLSEERFRTMFNRHNAVMLVVEPDTGAIIAANGAASIFYGYSPAQLVGMKMQELNCLPPGESAAERQGAAQEEGDCFLAAHRLANGEQRWVEVYSSPFDDSGRILLFSIIHDVTARKISENERNVAQHRLTSDYRALTHLQTISALFMRKGSMTQLLDTMLDAAIAIAEAEKGTLQLLDAQSDKLRIVAHRGLEQPFLEFWDRVRDGVEVYRTALQTAGSMVIDEIAQNPDLAGKAAQEMLSMAGVRAILSLPIQSRVGRMLGILSIHFTEPRQPDEQILKMLGLLATLSADIIERARNEAELSDSRQAALNLMDDAIMARKTLEEANARLLESEARVRLALTAGNMAAWDWNIPSGEVTWNNEHFVMLGYEPGEVQPSYAAWADRVHPEELAAVTAKIQECMQRHEIYNAEFRTLWPDGTIRWLEARGGFSYDDNGVPSRSFGVMLDTTDRKLNEEAMRTVLNRLSLAQRSSGAGLWDWDIQTQRLAWSPELFELFGFDPDQSEASFGLWRQVIHPDDCAVAEQRIKAAIEKKERLFSEYRIVGASGGIRWISAIGDTIYDDSGAPLRMSGICLDITERKQAEARMNLLADTAGVLLATDSPQEAVESLCTRALSILDCHAFFNFLADRETGRLRLNSCAGIPAEEKEKIQWLDYGVAVCGCVASDGCRIVAEDIQQSCDERTELVKSYGIKAYACHPLMLADEVIGTLSFGSCSRSSFSDEDLAVMKAVTDLVAIAMERKRTEESLSRAKKEWERTFDSVPDLIAILDEQHRIIRVNRSMAQHLGREPRDCIGVYCHEAIHGLTCPPSFCPHSHSLCDNQTHEVEIYEESLGGDFLVSTTPLHQDDGRLLGTVHVARDISDRKRAEEALILAHSQLEEKVKERTAQLADTIEVLQEEVTEREKAQESLKNEMVERLRVMESLREQEKLLILQSRQAAMGEMIGNIAHQWRQPLNILGLLMQQMETFYSTGKFDADFLGASVCKGMGIIQHMSQTIDDFRNFFRPEKEQKQFCIQESINSTIALINDSFLSYTIKIAVQSTPELEVVGYPNEFSQALLNILLNAKDVLLERKIDAPRISISVEKANCKCIIIIKDNAGGMAESIIDKIFDPYFTTKGPQQGTGLGLYMAKMIIEKNMGGHLSARNDADGAEFRIELENAQK